MPAGLEVTLPEPLPDNDTPKVCGEGRFCG
jgi:hypothetical protein